MKRFAMVLVMSLLLPYAAVAADKVENPTSCKQCGMDRVSFAHGRMMIVYADGGTAATCSLNCTVIEMKENKGKQVKSLHVADYYAKELIDARSATWVVGGNKSGVMTSLPKWAFARKADAQKFVKENGGSMTTFDEALTLALKENE